MPDNRPKYNFGDILLDITENGSDIIILPNNFACDPSLAMSANVTVFSNTNWWGNYILGDENKIGSDIETSIKRNKMQILYKTLPARGPCMVQGIILTLNKEDGKALSVDIVTITEN